MKLKTCYLISLLVVMLASFSLLAQTKKDDGNAEQKKNTTNQTEQTKKALVNSSDRTFIVNAAQSGMVEVELGRLAVNKANSAEVKQFGQQMVDDHSKAGDELKQMALQKEVALPQDLNSANRATVDKMSKLSGEAFDKAYISNMVKDHKKAVADFRKVSKSATDAELKAWAGKTLPTLEHHLTMAQSAETKTKGK